MANINQPINSSANTSNNNGSNINNSNNVNQNPNAQFYLYLAEIGEEIKYDKKLK